MLKISKGLFILTTLIFIGSLAFIYLQYTAFSNSLGKERKAEAQMLSQVAIGVIQHFHQLTLETGEVSDAQAQRYAMQALQAATYGEAGYFWINDLNGTMLMHPHQPELIGQNLIDLTDDQGSYLFREFVRTARAGGGWVQYRWPKPDSDVSVSKVSYIDFFEPWGWVLGNGVYLDDVEDEVFWTVARASGLLFILFSLFIGATVLWLDVFINRLEHQAIRDKLTGLYTKRYLSEVSSNILRNHARNGDQVLAAIFMDIDHFKQVNDSYGHATGDQVLRRLGEVVSSETRPSDYCIRYGGEEVLVLGLYSDLDAAAKAAERIRITFSSQSFEYTGHSFQATISAGVAAHRNDSDDLNETIAKADQKMYEAKASGRNRVSR